MQGGGRGGMVRCGQGGGRGGMVRCVGAGRGEEVGW